MSKFNGHKNWNHWNVSLWISNDYATYQRAVTLIRRYGKNGAARRLLSELPSHTLDGAPYSYSSVRAALAGYS